MTSKNHICHLFANFEQSKGELVKNFKLKYTFMQTTLQQIVQNSAATIDLVYEK